MDHEPRLEPPHDRAAQQAAWMRLWSLFGLAAAVGLWLWWRGRTPSAAARAGRTYRPRGSAHRDHSASAGAVHHMPRAAAQGLRDAYSSAAIDPDAELWTCNACQALYHAPSLQALHADNRGRCAACGASAFAPVRFFD